MQADATFCPVLYHEVVDTQWFCSTTGTLGART